MEVLKTSVSRRRAQQRILAAQDWGYLHLYAAHQDHCIDGLTVSFIYWSAMEKTTNPLHFHGDMKEQSTLR